MKIRADAGWLLLIVGVALVIRIHFPWPLVFTPTHVNLLETDAWYHLRAIENLVRQFPHHLRVDPYASSAGQFVASPPLFDFLVAAAAWIAGMGHPSEAVVTRLTVFAPPVLAALTIVAVYAVGRLAGGRLAGLLAAAMAAILPGHFLDRTLLGFADHHALESLMSAIVLCVIARALTRAESAVRSGLWLGLALVAFRLAWTSAAMIVAILVVWLLVHAALQSWRHGEIGGVASVTGIAGIVALPFTLMFQGMVPYRLNLQVASLSMLVVASAAVEVGRYGLRAGWWPPRVLVGLAIALVSVGTGIFAIAFPETARFALAELSLFALTTSASVVTETRPLFALDGTWSLYPAWQMFRSGFLLGLAALVFLSVRWWRRGQPLDLLLIVWTGAMYAATIGVNRFGYYLVPAIAIVGGIASASLIEAGRRAGVWWRSAAVAAVAAGVFGLNVVPAIATTLRPAGIPAAWFPAFDWLRSHAEEPFGDPNFYYARYDAQPIRAASAIVMVWWDYGYAMIAAAHRVPSAIPTQSGAELTAEFFTTADETRALDLLDVNRAKNVFVDEYLPFSVDQNGELFGKFQAMVIWAGAKSDRYFDTFLFRQGDHYQPLYLFFEDYYRTMTFRLGVAGGQAVVPKDHTAVVSWTVENVPEFGRSRVVSSFERFATYEAAAARLKQLGSGNHAIVGSDPLASALPLAPVRGLRRVYTTPAPGAFRQGAVQIFERIR